jgi:CelD/BcsL family acetyltransferase involved in cellulose biosynthesis
MTTTAASSTADPLTAHVAAGLEGLHALGPEWRALYEASDFEPSMSFEWTRALARTHLRDDDTSVLVQLRRGGRLVGAVPLVARAPKVFGLRHRLLRPLAELKNTHSDLLIAGHDPEALAALFDTLRPREYRWDSLRLSKLLEGASLTPVLEAGARRAGLIPRRRYRKPAYFLALPGTFEKYFAARSGKFRNHARRAEKKLRAAGRLQEVEIVTPEAFDAGYEALMEIERASWKEPHGTSMAAEAKQSALYREWGRTSPPGHVHLQLLLLDGEPIAHNLGCVHRGTYYYLKTSYAARHRPLGPATFLRLSLIRSLIGRGVTAVDFCGPPYDWEQQWTTTCRWHQVLSIYAPTLRGRILSALDPWTHYSTPAPVFGVENPRDQSAGE